MLVAAAPAAAGPIWAADGSIGVPFDPPRPMAQPEATSELVAWLEHYAPPVVDPGSRNRAASDPADLKPGRDAVIDTIDADGLLRKFDGVGYRLAAVRAGDAYVPRLYVDEMPRDMGKVESTALRKRLFIKTLLPLILRANEEVRAERRLLVQIAGRLERGQSLDASSSAFLDQMRAIYAEADTSIDELLRRIDVVPPSLALAQAAEESGWGTSRFVREGNAVFGQRTFSGSGGLVPLRRDRDATHLVRSFSHVQASVAAYMFNLNTHPAYADFRALRAQLRARGDRLDSDHLVRTLTRYSERGEDYVKTIRTILRVNELAQFDEARLSPPNLRPVPERRSEVRPVRWSF